MPTYGISLTFTSKAKNDDKAQELAERIGAYVQQEKMASTYSVVDVELLEEDEDADDGDDLIDFEDDDE